ncbi:hypothetical protein [uncultured Treponema sp.]|uniref:hypothetical protein n=1 Tax=uncultured Treponema sp. TaxID=162155 RepID=UPI000E95524D|nr:hypothetical protein [uncultured Treponema sp.]HAZ96792.1 hypothetical protein [Treponema sp.]
MKKFAKISAVLISLFLVFALLGCKDDSDDEQSYLLEYGLISLEDYNNEIKYISDVYRQRSQCLFYTVDDTYEKETVDESDLASELEGLTASQIQLIKESEALIQYFTITGNSEYIIWLYSQKQ